MQPRHTRATPEGRAYSAATQRRLYADRMAFLRRWKSWRGCADCPERDWRCLDIDHTSGKTLGIEKIRSIKRLKEEIRRHRCVVRCANCHRKRTYEEQLGAPARARRCLERP